MQHLPCSSSGSKQKRAKMNTRTTRARNERFERTLALIQYKTNKKIKNNEKQQQSVITNRGIRRPRDLENHPGIWEKNIPG